MELWVSKVLSGLVLLLITLVCGLVPVCFIQRLTGTGSNDWRRNYPRLDVMLGLLSAFGGGVFLGTAFLLLLPEARHWWGVVYAGREQEYPTAEIVAIAGLLLIMAMEHVIIMLKRVKVNVPDLETQECLIQKDQDQYNKGQGQACQGQDKLVTVPRCNCPCQSQVISANGLDLFILNQGSSIEKYLMQQGEKTSPWKPPFESKVAPLESLLAQDILSKNGPETLSSYTGNYVINTESRYLCHPCHHSRDNPCQASRDDDDVTAAPPAGEMRSLILLLALSVHTVFDGLTIGLQTAEKLVWTLLLAIALHRAIIVLVLGLQLAESRHRSRSAIFLVLFSLITPIGVGIGYAVLEAGDGGQQQHIATAVLQSLSAGVFIYVTFFEILHQEVGRDHNIVKVIAVIVGVGVMAGLASLGGCLGEEGQFPEGEGRG